MSNEKPLRLEILEKLTDALKTVSRSTPYNYDMAAAVFRGRTLFGDSSDPCPMLSILETPVPPEVWFAPRGSGETAGPWDLLIQGFIDDDRENPTDPAYWLMRDVKSVIKAEARRLGSTPSDKNILGMGNTIYDIKIHSGTVRPADEYSSVANFWLRITIEFADDN